MTGGLFFMLVYLIGIPTLAAIVCALNVIMVRQNRRMEELLNHIKDKIDKN